MSFKPGDKVWVENQPGGYLLGGTYPAVVVCNADGRFGILNAEWWEIEISNIDKRPLFSHQSTMRRRDDPPPQQEPQREAVGDWALCPWRPVSVPKEIA